MTSRVPCPRVIATRRTRPASTSRRTWSRASRSLQPLTSRSGSTGDAPTRASHASASQRLRSRGDAHAAHRRTRPPEARSPARRWHAKRAPIAKRSRIAKRSLARVACRSRSDHRSRMRSRCASWRTLQDEDPCSRSSSWRCVVVVLLCFSSSLRSPTVAAWLLSSGPGFCLLMLSHPGWLPDHPTSQQRGGGVVRQTAGSIGVHLQAEPGAGPAMKWLGLRMGLRLGSRSSRGRGLAWSPPPLVSPCAARRRSRRSRRRSSRRRSGRRRARGVARVRRPGRRGGVRARRRRRSRGRCPRAAGVAGRREAAVG